MLILVAEEGRAKAAPRLAAMTPEDRAYVTRDLLPVKTQAQVIALDLDEIDFRVTRRNRAILALSAALRREGWFPLQAFRETIETSQRKEIARANVAAFEASAHLQSITN